MPPPPPPPSRDAGHQGAAADSEPVITVRPKGVDKNVTIHFQAVGNAPIMQKMKLKARSAANFSVIVKYLQKTLGRKEPPFVYCHSAFCPSPDQNIGELFLTFRNKTTNELVLNYSIQEAWG